MPIKALRKTESTVHAFIMSADLSGSIDKQTLKKKKSLYCFHSNQLSLKLRDFFFHSPFYHIDCSVQSHKQGRLPLSAVTKRFRNL